MSYLKNERGLTMLYTLVVIIFLTFTVTKTFSNFFHLKFMYKSEHNVVRIEYFILLSIDYIEQLYSQDEEIKSGLLSISGENLPFELYKTDILHIVWKLYVTFDDRRHSFLLTMNKDDKNIVSWIQLE